MRYVIQNVKAENFKKMGLEVSETENGFSVTLGCMRYEEKIQDSPYADMLTQSRSNLIEWAEKPRYPLPFRHQTQTFNFQEMANGDYLCVAHERLGNDYPTLQYLIEEHNDFSGKGWWFCPHGATNKPTQRNNQRSKAELTVT